MNVLFVNMPFSAPGPPLGVSLLKAHTERLGYSARVEYPSLRFEELIGSEVFLYLANEVDCVQLSGDWVFAHCLSEAVPRRPIWFSVPDNLREGVLRARELATPFLEDCLEWIDWSSYDLIGFTTAFRQNVASLSLAKRVKERHPDIPIVFGGANCEGVMGLQLHRSFPFLDYVCTGEADVCFPQLLTSLAKGVPEPELDGIVVRRAGKSHYTDLLPEQVQDLDELPYPDFADYYEQQPLGPPYVLMETSRGCWWGAKHHCTFCGLNTETMTFRGKDPVRALDELLHLVDRYQPAAIVMVDNILDMRYFREFLPEVTRRGLTLNVFYEVKANLKRDHLRLLAEAGVRNIQPGIESFSTAVLHGMRKGTTALQNLQLLKWCREFGVRPHWNLLYGFPNEDPAEYAATAELIPSLHHLQPPIACGPVRLDRFSPLFTDSETFRLQNVRPARAYARVYGLPAEELANVAYFFDFDFEDGRVPRTYTTEVREAVRRWRDAFRGFGLVYADDGEHLGLFDYREETGRRRLLTGPARELYLYCEENRPAEKIVTLGTELGWAEAETEAFLEEMLIERLMAAADGRYVGLAVRKHLAADVENAFRQDENEALLAVPTWRR